MMRLLTGFLVLLGLLPAGCKNTEDYLNDLYTVQKEPDGSLPIEIYDAGQLAYEALTGLLRQKTLTLSQLGRAVAAAGRAADRQEVPLLRTQALALLAHLTLYYPIPPLSEPLENPPGRNRMILDNTAALRKAMDRLAVGKVLIPMLSSPDQATVDRAWRDLKRSTGEDLGRGAAAWESWWAEHREEYEARVAQEARKPLRTLGDLEYPSLGLAHLVLTLVATSLAISDLPELRPDIERTIMRISRQVVEMAVVKAITDDDSPEVRAEAALAAVQVKAHAFGDPLAQALAVERESDTKVRMLGALAWYPSKQTMQALLLKLGDADRPVRRKARDVLIHFARRDLGEEFQPWFQWWEQEGKLRWP